VALESSRGPPARPGQSHRQVSGDQGSACVAPPCPAVGGRRVEGGLPRTGTSKWRSGNASAGAGRWPPNQPLPGEALRGARIHLVKGLRERERPANRIARHPMTARLVADHRDDLVAVRCIVNSADPRWIGRRGRREDRDQGKDHRDDDDPPCSRQGGSRPRSLPLRGRDGRVCGHRSPLHVGSIRNQLPGATLQRPDPAVK